jgi:hypothetical protein
LSSDGTSQQHLAGSSSRPGTVMVTGGGNVSGQQPTCTVRGWREAAEAQGWCMATQCTLCDVACSCTNNLCKACVRYIACPFCLSLICSTAQPS